MVAHGRFSWTELNSHDPEPSKRFYAETIGWTYRPVPMEGGGTYWIIEAGGDMAGGIFIMSGPSFENMPEHWFSYLEVDDVDRRVEGVAAAGGSIVRRPWTIPNVGRAAIVRAPGGAVMAWITSVGS